MQSGKAVGLWVAAVAASALLFGFSTGIGPYGWLAWAAPAPVLVYALHSRSPWLSAAAAALAYLFGEAGPIYAYLTLVPLPVLIVTALIPAFAFALVVLAARLAALRLPTIVAVFSYPLLWTSWEFLLGLASPHGSAGALGYTQTGLAHVIQIASVTGVWGVSFLTAAPSMAIALATKGRAVAALAPSALLLAIALGFGEVRLRQPLGETRDFALIALPIAQDQDEVRGREASLAAARAYVDALSLVGPVRQGRSLTVVIPEKAITTFPEWEEEVRSALAGAARESGVTLIVGIDEHRADGRRGNMAYVFDANGQTRLAYQKRHLVPGLERDFTPGDALGVIGDEGVAICKDMDFPQLLRGYGRADVRILSAPAWDFTLDARPHADMAIMRAVENGFSLARVAQSGLLTLTDAHGRTIATERTSPDYPVWLRGELPEGDSETLYSRLGDVFGWSVTGLAGVLLLSLVFAAFRRRA